MDRENFSRHKSSLYASELLRMINNNNCTLETLSTLATNLTVFHYLAVFPYGIFFFLSLFIRLQITYQLDQSIIIFFFLRISYLKLFDIEFLRPSYLVFICFFFF